MSDTFQLGGRVLHLKDGRAGGGGAYLTSVAQGIDELRAEFSDRQGLRLYFGTLKNGVDDPRVLLTVNRHMPGVYLLEYDDWCGQGKEHYTTMTDLFDAAAQRAARCTIEWDSHA